MKAASVSDAYAAHRGPLFAYLVRLTRNVDTADDILQDSYTKLVSEVDAGRSPRDCLAWLRRVGRNLAVNGYRRQRVAQSTWSRLANDKTSSSPEDAYIVHEAEHEVTDLLRRLNDIDRTAVLMAAHGYSAAEIGRLIAVSEGAVRTRICRARRRLRQEAAQSESYVAGTTSSVMNTRKASTFSKTTE
jgi:RNA polymerase sigma factor (sigma-70 family)